MRMPESRGLALGPLLDWDSKWFETVAGFASRIYDPKTLDQKLAALVRLNLDVLTGQVHTPSVREHIQEALAARATRTEILEVFKIAAVIGIHSSAVARYPNPHRTRREDAARGAAQLNPLWEFLYQWEPEWLAALVDMGLDLWSEPMLPPLWIELLCLAGDAAVTQMFAPRARRHFQNALKLGATRDQILAVLQIGSLMGIESCELAIPILEEEIGTRALAERARP